MGKIEIFQTATVQCCHCGKFFTEPCSHKCLHGFRKHKQKWLPVSNLSFDCDNPKESENTKNRKESNGDDLDILDRVDLYLQNITKFEKFKMHISMQKWKLMCLMFNNKMCRKFEAKYRLSEEVCFRIFVWFYLFIAACVLFAYILFI